MAQEFLPKDIKTYPEATSLEGINLFGHNATTGEGVNVPTSLIPGGGGGGDIIVVTYNSGTGTADKSYTEIAAALQSGKSVVLKSISAGGESFYTHTGSGSSGVEFSLVYNGSDGPIIKNLTVSPSNIWSETLHQGASKDYVDNGLSSKIGDAPADGLLYGRKNNQWSPVIEGFEQVSVSPLGGANLLQMNCFYRSGLLYINGTISPGTQFFPIGSVFYFARIQGYKLSIDFRNYYGCTGAGQSDLKMCAMAGLKDTNDLYLYNTNSGQTSFYFNTVFPVYPT